MRNDLMDRLAAGRPAELDRVPDDRRRAIDLSEAMAHTPAHSRRDHRAALRTARRTTLGLASAVGAAAVAVALGHRPAAPHTPPGRTPHVITAPAILLAAADKAAAAPGSAGAGAYWHVTARYFDLEQIGRSHTPEYQVQTVSQDESWLPRNGHARGWTAGQDFGARPATPADRTAWRRAGSPVTFRTSEWGEAVPSAPGKRTVKRTKPGHGLDLFDEEITASDVRRLPDEPGPLKKALTHLIKKRVGAEEAEHGDELFTWAADILMFYPASPKLRAATYRMLAGMTGTLTKVGPATDPTGRTGIAIASDAGTDEQGSQLRDQLILDPATGQALAWETVFVRVGGSAPKTAYRGQAMESTVVLNPGWTDDEPKP